MNAAPHAVNGAPSRGRDAPSAARRVLPHNLDLEAGVLGGVLLRNECLALINALEVEDFYDHRNKVVFQAMRALATATRPIDVVTLESEIEKTGKLDAVGGIAYLGELGARVPTPDNVVDYAQQMQILARNRRVILELGAAFERAWTWAHDPSELLIETVGTLQRLEADKPVAGEAKARWCIPLDEFFGEDEPSDDDAEDWIIRDLIPRAEPMLWGGPMKGGKTWAALDVCIAIALGESWLGRFENTLGPGRAMGIFLEDNKRRIGKRLWELSRARGVTPNDRRLRDNLRISRASLKLPDAKDLRQLIAEARAWRPAIIVIDNLTRVMVGDPNSTKDASAFTKAWAEIGEETGATILFLHHTKKALGDDRDADPFDLLRGSGDFGATARNIVVTKPIRSSDDAAPKLAEVRMRGNLDLRCESFVLGFERKEHLGRWHARLVDKGEVEQVKEDASKNKREAKQAKKRDEQAAEQRRRRDLALSIVHKEGAISQARLALELGLSSPNTVKPLFDQLVANEVLEPAGRRGFILKTDRPAQGGLL